jgi:hypothetical protein
VVEERAACRVGLNLPEERRGERVQEDDATVMCVCVYVCVRMCFGVECTGMAVIIVVPGDCSTSLVEERVVAAKTLHSKSSIWSTGWRAEENSTTANRHVRPHTSEVQRGEVMRVCLWVYVLWYQSRCP